MRFLWYTPTQYCRLSPVELDIGAKRCNAGEYSTVRRAQRRRLAVPVVLRCRPGICCADPWERSGIGPLFRSFRDREEDPPAHGLPEKCWECPDLPALGGGCRIEREAADGRRARQRPWLWELRPSRRDRPWWIRRTSAAGVRWCPTRDGTICLTLRRGPRGDTRPRCSETSSLPESPAGGRAVSRLFE